MTNYVGRALYEQQYQKDNQLDADRAIRLFEEYDIPITTIKEETPDGTLFGPFPDGSYILSFTHNGEQNMFSASSKDKINQLFQDVTFASVEDNMIRNIDKKKESPPKPDHHPMIPSWKKFYHLAKAIELNISKALSDCDYKLDHLMDNITYFVEPDNIDAIKDILKGIKNVGNILRGNLHASPSKKLKIANTEHSTPLGFIIVVNYDQSSNRLRVSTIKSTTQGERFHQAFASDGPYTPEFLDAIQSGALGLNACPLCLSEGCKHCQNGIIDLSPTQETFLRNIISSQFKIAAIRFNPDYPTATSDEDNEIFSSSENIIYKDISPLFKDMSIKDSKLVLHRLLKDPKNRASNIIVPFIAVVKRIINEKSTQSADDNSIWLQAFSQLNSMLSNFKKLHKVSWTISDDKLNSLFQELLPLFVKYALIIRDKPPHVSQPMVDSANKIISELSIIFNIEI
jgi:hypothetical protein